MPRESEAFLRTWRVPETAEYLVARKYTRATLQFPDHLLSEAAKVAVSVQEYCASRDHEVQAYILADTTYNSLSVDEVAAAHVDADCVVHYGRASMTALSRIPAFFVFPTQDLDVDAVASNLSSSTLSSLDTPVLCFLDQPHLHQRPELAAEVARRMEAAGSLSPHWTWPDVPIRQLEPEALTASGAGLASCRAGDEHAQTDSAGGATRGTCCANQGDCSATAPADSSVGELRAAGYRWSGTEMGAGPVTYIWIGAPDAPALQLLQLTRSTLPWWTLDPTTYTLEEGLPVGVRRLLRRRYALMERARDASIVGVLVGTLGVAGYLGAVEQLCNAAEAAGKKTYTLLMGKPSPAKLANFPEIEVFVLVADPQGQILDCKEYLAPIITHHEAMLAFSPDSEWDESLYRLDFETDGPAQASEETDATSELALRAAKGLRLTPVATTGAHALTPASAADYLVHKRSWRGVEAPLAGAAPAVPRAAVEGRSGRAAGYQGEPSNL
ncbi:CGL150 [Auxenochlorella protothecoides x Auxenochlorella symbiontica]